MTSSNYKFLTASNAYVVTKNPDDFSAIIFSQIVYPTYFYPETAKSIDGSDPLNLPNIGDIQTSSAGVPNISATSSLIGGFYGGFFNDNQTDLSVMTPLITSYPTT